MVPDCYATTTGDIERFITLSRIPPVWMRGEVVKESRLGEECGLRSDRWRQGVLCSFRAV